MTKRWLVVGAHDVDPAKNGSALRIRQHMERLHGEGKEVEYFKAAPEKTWDGFSTGQKILASPRILAGALLGDDPNCTMLFDRVVANRLVAKIREFKPKHIIFCESWMTAYATAAMKGGPYGFWWYQYIDLHNVESRLRLEVSRGKNGVWRFAESRRASLMFESEFWLTNTSDQTWVCSRVDQEHVKRLYGIDSVVIPNKIDVRRYENVSQCDDKTFGMVGIWSYGPNGEAGGILVNEIWPDIPEATPILAGKNPTDEMMDAVAHGAVVLGEIPDTRSALARMRTVVVPLRKGGGTRMKILEAMAAGVPVVATEKAVEGLEVEHLRDCVICEPEEMAGWIRKLWDSPGLESLLRTNARALVQEKYSW